jgi:hypothetical protein
MGDDQPPRTSVPAPQDVEQKPAEKKSGRQPANQRPW